MPNSKDPQHDLAEVIKQISRLRILLEGIDPENLEKAQASHFLKAASGLILQLQSSRQAVSPTRLGPIGITLGRSDSIAKFFAFSFINQEKRTLADLLESPFFGSGVYSIYYHGDSEQAYQPLSGSETPIYVGKADPKDPYAETVEAQGTAIFNRLKEHARSMKNTGLNLHDFSYRYAAIQTGMQSSVEEFMIRLFRPIWNKEVKICYGIGKHGDKATTRANKRSPWDTMHPGRNWATDTIANQVEREKIETNIGTHLQKFPAIPNKEVLFKLLSLD